MAVTIGGGRGLLACGGWRPAKLPHSPQGPARPASEGPPGPDVSRAGDAPHPRVLRAQMSVVLRLRNPDLAWRPHLSICLSIYVSIIYLLSINHLISIFILFLFFFFPSFLPPSLSFYYLSSTEYVSIIYNHLFIYQLLPIYQLSIYLSIYPAIHHLYLSTYLSMYLCISLSLSLSLSIHPSPLSISLSLYLSIHPLYLVIYLSIYLSSNYLCLSIYGSDLQPETILFP